MESSHWLNLGGVREPASPGFRGQFTSQRIGVLFFPESLDHSLHQGRIQVELLGGFQKSFCLKHLKTLFKELSASM